MNLGLILLYQFFLNSLLLDNLVFILAKYDWLQLIEKKLTNNTVGNANHILRNYLCFL